MAVGMAKIPEHLRKLFPHHDNFGDVIGYELESYGDAWARTSLTIIAKHISPAGTAHGGAISAFVDWSMGCSVFTTLEPGQMCSTIEFKINYLSPVQLGEKIYCDTKVKFRGRSHAVIEFHVFRDEGKDIAVGVGTFNVYSKTEATRKKTKKRT